MIAWWVARLREPGRGAATTVDRSQKKQPRSHWCSRRCLYSLSSGGNDHQASCRSTAHRRTGRRKRVEKGDVGRSCRTADVVIPFEKTRGCLVAHLVPGERQGIAAEKGCSVTVPCLISWRGGQRKQRAISNLGEGGKPYPSMSMWNWNWDRDGRACASGDKKKPCFVHLVQIVHLVPVWTRSHD